VRESSEEMHLDNNPAFHLVSFCSGTAGLDIGVELALDRLGIRGQGYLGNASGEEDEA
jgi:hypothetical protein